MRKCATSEACARTHGISHFTRLLLSVGTVNRYQDIFTAIQVNKVSKRDRKLSWLCGTSWSLMDGGRRGSVGELNTDVALCFPLLAAL